MSSQTPSTQFAGDSNPNSGKSQSGNFLPILIGVVLLPYVFIVAGISYLSFVRNKNTHKTLGLYALVSLILGVLVSFFFNIFNLYIDSWMKMVNVLTNSVEAVSLGALFKASLGQIPLSIIIGLGLGALYSTWRWKRKPVWEERTFDLSPLEKIRKNKNINDIKNHNNVPIEGRVLGIDARGEKILQTDASASAHCLAVGGSGTGKTTTILSMISNHLARGEAAIIIDMKGAPDLTEAVAQEAKAYGKRFFHFTGQDTTEPYYGPSENGPAFYDPIPRGDETRRKDLVMSMKNWSESHYEIIIADYLQLAIKILIGNPPEKNVDSLTDIVSVLDPMALKERAYPLANDPEYKNAIAEINYMVEDNLDRDAKKVVHGMRKVLGTLRNSIHGRWLRKDPTGKNDINFRDIVENGDVVVFTLDSGNYAAGAPLIGNLIVQDLKTLASELRNSGNKKRSVIFIDEFSGLGGENIQGLVARVRDAKMQVIIATQSLGDLEKISSSFANEVLGAIGSFIIHRPNIYDEAEVFAGLTGKTKKQIFSANVEHKTSIFGLGKSAGKGSGIVKTEDVYNVEPTEFLNLEIGNMIYINKSPLFAERVQVIDSTSKNSIDVNNLQYEALIINEEISSTGKNVAISYDSDPNVHKFNPLLNEAYANRDAQNSQDQQDILKEATKYYANDFENESVIENFPTEIMDESDYEYMLEQNKQQQEEVKTDDDIIVHKSDPEKMKKLFNIDSNTLFGREPERTEQVIHEIIKEKVSPEKDSLTVSKQNKESLENYSNDFNRNSNTPPKGLDLKNETGLSYARNNPVEPLAKALPPSLPVIPKFVLPEIKPLPELPQFKEKILDTPKVITPISKPAIKQDPQPVKKGFFDDEEDEPINNNNSAFTSDSFD